MHSNMTRCVLYIYNNLLFNFLRLFWLDGTNFTQTLFEFQGLNKFYDAVMQSILRHVDFNIVKCVILASPGFVKDQCYEYMVQMAIKTDNKLLLDNRGKFLLVKASSGFKHSLKGKGIV